MRDFSNFYDQVETLVQERGITQPPSQDLVKVGFLKDKTPEEVAFEIVADWDVD